MKPRTAKSPKRKGRKPVKAGKKPKAAKAAKAAKKKPTLSMTHDHPAATDHSCILLDPTKLSLAPELAAVPMMGDVVNHLRGKPKAAAVMEEMNGERAGVWTSLDEIGIREPLKVTLIEPKMVNGELSYAPNCAIVWDGRHRLEWALARGQETVPVMVVSEAVGRRLMEASVIGRRHWTKGQRAYLGVICHPEVAGASSGRPKKSDSVGISNAPALATHLGVSADIVNQAVIVYRAFHAPGEKPNSAEAIEAADCKAKYEMSIWAGAGLGAVIAGIGGGKATHGKDRKASDWAALDKPLGTMTRLSHLWDGWAEDERSKALRLMSTRFKDDFSPAFRLALSEALAAADDVT